MSTKDMSDESLGMMSKTQQPAMRGGLVLDIIDEFMPMRSMETKRR